MPASSLTALLQTKYDYPLANETNLETGQLFTFYPSNQYATNFWCHICWKPPANGVATIEVWGAAGSGAEMCCCGGGIPGNPGGYSKKVLPEFGASWADCYICAQIGLSCNNTDDLCYRGMSEPTQVCWLAGDSDGCICAQGGRGGTSFCSSSPAMFCCYLTADWCGTQGGGAGCGIICNYRDDAGVTYSGADYCAFAYGGDVNCYGGFSCMYFKNCYPNCNCRQNPVIRIPPGMISEKGGQVQYAMDTDNERSEWSGMGGIFGVMEPLNMMTRNPTQGAPYNACWTGNSSCGCYQDQGAINFFPGGVPGQGPTPCDGVRDHAWRGGNGIMRIKFVPSA
ncbi:uncharacterized protein METZ01_LOCUS116150 [marine metagenome]|uniref:Uncharacterized protein n=1 Tax=marine metagenome TaxID=408172 RepID=A0A381XEY1_9ZZZZ